MRKRFESLWAIRPEAVLTVVRLMARDSAALAHSPAIGTGRVEMAATQWEATKPTTKGANGNKIAIIPIQGVLTNDGPSYYGTNYQTISDAAEKAANDPDVKRIVLSVDSPGGSCQGLPECAAVLARVAKVKPLHAIVEGSSASAAYWLTSQASDITVTPSGEVGSVGVRMMHVDMSKMLDAEGYKVTELHSGDFKTEWSPYSPLSEEAKADMQTRLDATHQEFLGAISSGRGSRASASVKKGRFGEGRMFSSSEAKLSGMVDHIQPTTDFFRSIAGGDTASKRQRLAVERARM